jgi:hypothetical protein
MESYEKRSGTSLKTFPLICGFFPKAKTHNMLCMMLDACNKGLGLAIQFVGKERAWQIIGEYDYLVLLSLLVFAYNFLNPSDVSVITLSSRSHIIEITSLLYNLTKIDEEMASSMVKE